MLDLVLSFKDLTDGAMKLSTEEIDLLFVFTHGCGQTLNILLCTNDLIHSRIKFALNKILFFSFISDKACKGCDCILSFSNLSEGASKLASNLADLLSILFDYSRNFVDNVFGLSNLNDRIFESVFDQDVSTLVNAHSNCDLLE